MENAILMLKVSMGALAGAAILLIVLAVLLARAERRARDAEHKFKVIAAAERLKRRSQETKKRAWERNRAE